MNINVFHINKKKNFKEKIDIVPMLTLSLKGKYICRPWSNGYVPMSINV